MTTHNEKVSTVVADQSRPTVNAETLVAKSRGARASRSSGHHEEKCTADPTKLAAPGPEVTAEANPATFAPLAAEKPAPWSSEDEAAFQVLCARRKAAGFGQRGSTADSQLIGVGPLKPNKGTVAATMVEIVASVGTISRAGMVSKMADSAFPQPSAKPADPAWCKGYIAGAIRNGFLCVAQGAPGVEAKEG